MPETEKTETPPPPQKAGQYYILEKVAQGGMAEIYKGLAYDPAGIKKTVCIKKILPHIAASREFIDMLVDEAKIAVRLNHGNIAQIYDLGKAGDDYFIVMEYVDGQTLSRLHKKVLRLGKKIPLPVACYLVSETASGLNYMHRKTDEAGGSLHIVHRDISPQNVMVSYSGTVKIIDFGIAKAAANVGHTESGILKGKFAYMSPEQARGDPLDHRSDIFSLGVIFHELLTGKRLFKGADSKQTLRNVRKAKVPPPSEWNPALPKEIDAIVLKTLAKDRRHRYAFSSDFQEELQKFLHTHFPDFRPSQTADYVRQVFQDELDIHRRLPAEGGVTPQLILDKTQTAHADEISERTSGGGAIDWREFMLDAEWPEETHPPPPPDPEEESPEEKAGEHTDRKKAGEPASFPKEAFLWGSGLAALLSLGLAGYFGWQYYEGRERKPAERAEPAVTIRQAEEPKPASLVIETNPAGASVYLDDREIGQTTPAQIIHLPPGEKHTLGLYLTNHKFFKTEFETKPGETQKFHIELAIDYGALKIVSEPAGAPVFLDGKPAGITPFFRSDLLPGRIVTVEIRLDGFKGHVEALQIAAGKEHLVHAPLERLPLQRVPSERVPSLPVPKTEPIMDPEIKPDEEQGTDHRPDDHHED